MPKQQQNATNTKSNGVTVGFEAKLWAATVRRNYLNAAEYRHNCLGLFFLKLIRGQTGHNCTRFIHGGPTDQTVAAPRSWSN